MTGTARKRIVLVGAGHTHLLVAARARELVALRAEVILVDPGVFCYSGMATGVLGGKFTPEEDQVDPEALIRKAGGTFLRDRLTGLDAEKRSVHLASGKEIPYDMLSLNLGSEPNDKFPGLKAHAWPVKPITNLYRLHDHLRERFAAGGTSRVAIIGGGPTACEVAGNIDALARQHGANASITLLSRSERLVPDFSAAASEGLRRHFVQRGIELRLGTGVTASEPGQLHLENGETMQCDVAISAIGLCAPAILKTLGLPLDSAANLRVRDTLQSLGGDAIFGAGDCIAIEGCPLPKVGVFGVRQGPVLLGNLLAALEGQPLASFVPQQHYLLVLNLGMGRGLAIRGHHHWLGRASLLLKNFIDRRFMRRFQAMAAEPAEGTLLEE